MLHTRIIPVILLLNGRIVQSRNFNRYQILGTPTAAVKRLSSWSCDEIIYIDISKKPYYTLVREDLGHDEFSTIEDIVGLIAKQCNMPLTFGGGIRSIKDVEQRLFLGADKVTINKMAIESPEFIRECAKEFGSQAIVASVDVRKVDGVYKVFKSGRLQTDLKLIDHLLELQENNVGEILINSMDNDGSGKGFDIELINFVVDSLDIPVIAMGGAGSWEDFSTVLNKTNVNAIAAANIFQHSENSVYTLKNELYESGYNVREPLELSLENDHL